jgi:glycosyltransferase involved in cell wall biosynthesis
MKSGTCQMFQLKKLFPIKKTMHFPKVLIISHPFNKNNGGGITMSNLFKGWPKDKLALASSANIMAESDYSVCEMYYQLGYNGKLHPFPLNIILPRISCGPVIMSDKKDKEDSKKNYNSGKYKKLYSLLRVIMNFLGIYNFLYKLKITQEFKDWVLQYDPDIIYSQLSTLELIRFVMEVHKFSNKPIALHIMDDWPLTINKPGLLYLYWGRVINREFRALLDKSSILMSICDSMSEEYKIRYNKEFFPFHNPIDTKNWLPFSKKDWTKNDKFTILYAGRIGLGMKNTIIDIAKVVHYLSATHKDIVFEIQTNDIHDLKNSIEFNNNVKWVKPIKYTDLPSKFSSVDLLVLPIDFDKESIRFMKYSFPTKISEYMISGTPVLVYADKRTAVAKYSLKEGWGYLITEQDNTTLKKAIIDLYSDPVLRKKLGYKARELAEQKEDAEIVRESFRKCLIIN